ncbi:MAG: 4-hydroxy-3-methylbut-2-enyl diphosphate reductase [Magnetococcales bacterium]|nr:4-hydroxy-3-methylbut-2-enyl diphosphate reductase [Magnetococcales bacterium]
MRVLLASPRGFCAGVHRAIAIVEKALETFGRPIYVRHEIVHNRRVVEDLRQKGAVFVDELDDVPDDATVIFSAHGVSKAVQDAGNKRPLRVLDATCPLVAKVHREAERHYALGNRVILIGHKGHPEVVGTVGHLPDGAMEVISNAGEVYDLPKKDHRGTAYITQTTLSVDETAETVQALRARFPDVEAQAKEDICYATQNRQNAVKALAEQCDLVLVLGAPNSSNSNRLREVAERAGTVAKLIESAQDVKLDWLEKVETLGITAGASAPEVLLDELMAFLGSRVSAVDLLSVSEEDVHFALPEVLRQGA